MSISMKKRVSFIATLIVCVVVVGVAMAWLSGTFRKGMIAPGKLEVVREKHTGPTVLVEKVTRPAEVELVGSVESALRATVASRLTANIVTLSVNAGDAVKRGDILVQLDDRDIKARAAQARESLRAAQASMEIAKGETERLGPLFEQQAASRSELDNWRGRYEGGKAEVARAQQVIAELDVQLSDAIIRAPFDGVVIDRNAEPGDLASPGKALLTMYDPTRLRLDAAVREAYIARLDELRKSQQPVNVVIQATGKVLKGMVEQIVPVADPASRSFLAKVRLDNSEGLYPGMFGRLRVPMENVDVIEIPSSAVREVGQVTLVNVVSDGEVQSRAVRLGASRDGKIEVLSGLRASEQVAIAK